MPSKVRPAGAVPGKTKHSTFGRRSQYTRSGSRSTEHYPRFIAAFLPKRRNSTRDLLWATVLAVRNVTARSLRALGPSVVCPYCAGTGLRTSEKAEPRPTDKSSTADALLAHAGTWQGDDLDACLDVVRSTRGQAEF